MAEGAALNEKVEAVLDEEVTPAPKALEVTEGAGELQIVPIVEVECIKCNLPKLRFLVIFLVRSNCSLHERELGSCSGRSGRSRGSRDTATEREQRR